MNLHLASRSRYLYAAVLGCCALARMQDANAELSFGLGVGAGYSDNVARSADRKVEETIAVAGLDLEYREQTSRLEANVLADLAYRDYLDNTFDSEVVGGLDGQATFTLAPERFLWIVEDNFGQNRRNALQAARPDNREYINQFATGPDVLMKLGGIAGLRLSGRYSNTSYEESEFDSQRLMGSAALERTLSAISVLSLVGSYETVEYDATALIDPDYDVRSVYLQFAAEGSRTRLIAKAGYTQLDQFDENSDGVLADLDLTRQISPAATLSIGGGSKFSNAGDMFRRIQRHGGVGNDGIAIQPTNEAFEDRHVFASWAFVRNRTQLTLRASHNEESYERSTELDRSYSQWSARVSRQLRRSVELRGEVYYEQYDYDNVDLDANELRLRAGVNWAVLSRLGLALTYERMERSSNGEDVSDDEFTENQFWLMLTYTPRTEQ